jgi:hypothetical protein
MWSLVLNNMLPILPSSHRLDTTRRNTITRSDNSSAFLRCSDISHCGFSEKRQPVGFPAFSFKLVSAFSHHVRSVICKSSSKYMPGANTTSVIATVQSVEPLWYRSDLYLIRKSMREDSMAGAMPEHPITLVVKPADPLPASVANQYEIPKMAFYTAIFSLCASASKIFFARKTQLRSKIWCSHVTAILLGVSLCNVAEAQFVQQSGNVTPGHSSCFAAPGVVYDCGAPGGGVSVVGSTTQNDLAAFNGSGSLIDSGISPSATSNISGLWNFNGGATTPTLPLSDNSTKIATTAFVNAFITGGFTTKTLTIADTITNSASDVLTGILYVDKTVNFSSPGGASTGIFSAIYGQNNVSQGTWSNQVGVYGIINNSNTQHSQPLSTASAVGVYGVGVCEIIGCSSTWGGVMAAYDVSAQASPPFPLIGLEVDNYANGVGAGNRVGIQIVAGTPLGTGTVNSVDHGILFAGSGAAGNGQFVNLIDGSTAKTQNGIVLASMTITGIAWNSPGTQIDNVGNTIFQSLALAGCSIGGNVFCTPNAGGASFGGPTTFISTVAFTGGVPALSNGVASISGSAVAGALITGQGSSYDVFIENKNGGAVCSVATGTTIWGCGSLTVTTTLTLPDSTTWTSGGLSALTVGAVTASAVTATGAIKGQSLTATGAATTTASQTSIGNATTVAGSGNCPSGTVGGKSVAGCINVGVGASAQVIPYF